MVGAARRRDELAHNGYTSVTVTAVNSKGLMSESDDVTHVISDLTGRMRDETMTHGERRDDMVGMTVHICGHMHEVARSDVTDLATVHDDCLFEPCRVELLGAEAPSR